MELIIINPILYKTLLYLNISRYSLYYLFLLPYSLKIKFRKKNIRKINTASFLVHLRHTLYMYLWEIKILSCKYSCKS